MIPTAKIFSRISTNETEEPSELKLKILPSQKPSHSKNRSHEFFSLTFFSYWKSESVYFSLKSFGNVFALTSELSIKMSASVNFRVTAVVSTVGGTYRNVSCPNEFRLKKRRSRYKNLFKMASDAIYFVKRWFVFNVFSSAVIYHSLMDHQ